MAGSALDDLALDRRSPGEIAASQAAYDTERERTRHAREAERALRAEEERQRWLRVPRYDTPDGPGRPFVLCGRVGDGGQRDQGRRVHVLTADQAGWGTAVCRATPGRRSTGWSADEGPATCPSCLAKATLAASAGGP